jgi:hypothetical protein
MRSYHLALSVRLHLLSPPVGGDKHKVKHMPKSYKTEVCVQGEWSTNGCRYATEAEATEAGHELLNRWMVPTDSRPAPSEDPVNWCFNMETYRGEALQPTTTVTV